MAKEKACLQCKRIYEGVNCPNCGSNNSTSSFKGKMFVFNAEKSEIASESGINKDGEFAVKTK